MPTMASTSRTTITTLIFLPVSVVMEWLRSTSFSRFRPSGVISKTHANTSAGGKPISSSRKTSDPVHSGTGNRDDSTSVSCSSSHAETKYRTATRMTLRRLSSPKRVIHVPALRPIEAS
jgi:hypothetical protein